MGQTYNAIIIDDEPMARDILTQHLSKIDTLDVVAACKSATEGFKALNEHKVDLVFLDINMPEVTGLMFANAIQKKTQIIFTTAYREYAVEGFELEALDYLLKPISLERLMKAVSKFLAIQEKPEIELTHNFTFFRSDRKMIKVNFEDLSHVESCGDYIKLHGAEEVYTTRETMANVLQKLPATQFLRVHRSFVVAISKVDSFTNEHITIGRTAIPISRSYRESVLETLHAIN